MRHTLFYLALSFLVFGCKTEKKETKTKTESEKVNSTSTQTTKVEKNNYAVVWSWTTTNEQLVSDNSVKISNELTSLWKKGIVENAYYDANSKVDKFAYFPNISFSLNAKSLESAKNILNKLTVVKKGIASYKLYPIGNLWLDRKEDVINKNGMTKSFVTIWTTINKPNDVLIQAQNDEVLKLWNSGKVENVYFNIQGTQKANNKTDFMFYVNANSETDVKAICESLPFFKENIATYKVYDVGVFWMGKYE